MDENQLKEILNVDLEKTSKEALRTLIADLVYYSNKIELERSKFEKLKNIAKLNELNPIISKIYDKLDECRKKLNEIDPIN